MKTIKDILNEFDNRFEYLYHYFGNGDDNESATKDVKQFLKDSLTSMLDSIKKELPEAMQIKHDDWLMSGFEEYRKGDVKSSHNNYRQEVINIINSHR